MSKKTFTIILIVLIAIILGIGYMLFLRSPANPNGGLPADPNAGFNPFPRTGTTTDAGKKGTSTSMASTTIETSISKIPALRQLYATPVGGMGATTTASSTLVHFIDRGTGHIYEASSDSLMIKKLSNTTISRVNESYWSQTANAAVLRYTQPDSDKITAFFAQLRRTIPETAATGTSSAKAPVPTTASGNSISYELKGNYLSTDILSIAVSPKRDKLFEISYENGKGVGYVASFDERTRIQMFDTPLTQVNIEWPEENTLAMTTKGSASTPGYLYFFNIKKGTMAKVIGPVRGLSTLTSHDATKILYGAADGLGTLATIYNTKDSSTQPMVF
ncbi:MAG: seg, partial [Candidatus Taylorbacteria bacterium]|nr:seg [Candidatus Taylorbacteria bacterium]